jgi:hypothetical protein
MMSASPHEHTGSMMAFSPCELEQRVSDLEAEMDKLKRKLDQLDDAKPWWEQITGTFEDEPVYDEAMKRGRQWGAVQIKRRDGSTFTIMPVRSQVSPLDVGYVDIFTARVVTQRGFCSFI